MNLKSEKLENSTKFQKYHRYTAALPTREFSIRWVKNQTYRLHRVAHRFSPPTLHPHRLPFTDRYRNFACDPDFVPTVGNFSFVLNDLSFLNAIQVHSHRFVSITFDRQLIPLSLEGNDSKRYPQSVCNLALVFSLIFFENLKSQNLKFIKFSF